MPEIVPGGAPSILKSYFLPVEKVPSKLFPSFLPKRDKQFLLAQLLKSKAE